MREEYYAGDANSYPPNQIIVNNVNVSLSLTIHFTYIVFQYTQLKSKLNCFQQFQPDARFCPGCKLHLKRSIFYHHSRMIKKYGICNMFTPKRFPCGVPGVSNLNQFLITIFSAVKN